MFSSLILDALLLLILVLLIPIGVFRGGIREGFTSAGLLLGVALAAEWSVTWGDWIAERSRLADGPGRFLVATGLLIVATVGVGYGSAAAFAYQPGPGGRLYGAMLAALNGVVFLGFVLDYVITFIFDNARPELIDEGYVAKALASGTGLILLVAAGIVSFATVFGLFVRERSTDEAMGTHPFETDQRTWFGRPGHPRHAANVATVDKFEPVSGEGPLAGSDAYPQSTVVDSLPVQVRQIRHWERETPEPGTGEPPASGWSRTWPADSLGPEPKPPWADTPSARSSMPSDGQDGAPSQPAPGNEVLRHWLRQDGRRRARPESDRGTTDRPPDEPRSIHDERE